MNSRDRILLVDDDPQMHTLLRVCLTPLGYDIESAADGPQALAMLKDGQYNVVTLDLMMPAMHGLDMLRTIREQRLPTEVVVITAHGTLQSAIEALRLGAYDYVLKPFAPEAIRSAVHGAIDKQQHNKKLAAIYDLSQQVTLARNVNQVAQAVLDVAHRVLEFVDCGLWLIDQPRGELHRIALDTTLRDPALDVLTIEGSGVIAAAARSGQSIYVPDVTSDARYLTSQRAACTELAVPLCVEDRVIGVLNLESEQPQAFSRDEQQLASILAAQAAVAIENARLHQAERHEIAERRRAMEELRLAKEAAEAANQAKSEFLARMSHEIRTPIHAIIGTTELVLETVLTREQQDYLNLARSSTEALQTVINDILDFSKIEAHRLELDAIEFDVRTVVEQSVSMLALRAHRKGLDLICQLPPDVPTALIGDPNRLQQVLVNLVGNAVKFTEHGEVSVRVDMIGHDDLLRTVQLCFVVQDTGIGIARDKQAAMFEAFTQADGSASRRYGGTGLGLTIARQLVELMGGQIEVDSNLGAGSRFSFTLRLPKPPASGADMPQPGMPLSLADVAVLVVDDNVTQRRALHDLLVPLGLIVAETDRTGAAAELIDQAAAAGRPFQLILLNKRLADGDGLQAAAQQLQAVHDKLVLLLPSDNLTEDLARCRASGVTAHLVKPLKQQDVWDLVITRLGPAKNSAQPTAPVVARQLEGPRLNVLLADDNLAGQLIGRQTLQKMGHTVQIAATGREVLRLLEVPSAVSIDLVLMDVEMPEMDGLEAIQSIRAAERVSGQHLPILAMTAYAMKEDRARCLAAGADGYLSKPITPDQLLTAIEEFWSSTHVSRPAVTPVELDVALEMAGGDRALLLESVSLFLEQDYPRHWQELQDGLTNRERLAVKRAAHGLKGALDSFGGWPARDLALRLEAVGRSGDLTNAAAIAAELQEEINRFAAFYHDLAGA